MANLLKHGLPVTKVSDGGAEDLTLRLADGASAERDGRQWRRRTRLWCTSADVFGEKTLRLELYLVLLRLIGTLAAVNTVPPCGDGLRLRAAELMTALKRRRSIVFPCGLRFTQSGGRAEAKPQKGAFFCISPDSWMASFTQKKKRFSNLQTSVANPCKPLTLTLALNKICTWQVGLIILSAGLRSGKDCGLG